MTSQRPIKAVGPNAILGVVLIVYLMILLDLSIVYTGMPEIGETMGMSAVMQTWVQNAYLLFFGGFLLLSARLGDTFGRRLILQLGIGPFTLASLVIGISQSQYELIAARAVQGLGASILAPSVLAVISTTFPEGSERTRALAWYSVVAGAGSSLGMVLGGIFAGFALAFAAQPGTVRRLCRANAICRVDRLILLLWHTIHAGSLGIHRASGRARIFAHDSIHLCFSNGDPADQRHHRRCSDAHGCLGVYRRGPRLDGRGRRGYLLLADRLAHGAHRHW